MEPKIPIDMERLTAFCEKWNITEFSLFGSVLTDAFRPDSDVDVMVKFAEEARWGFFALYDMEEELRALFGHNVDLVTRPSIERSENYLMRRSILSSTRTFYAA